MKKILLVLFSLFIFFNFLSVNALVEPTDEFYINDYANILSDSTEKYILEKSVKLGEVTGAQVVVVTVPNLDGEVLEDYATDLFRSFGIGNEEEDNGLLLLLALEERQFRVEVGYGLEGVLPDGLTGRYQDQYIIPYLKDNEWDEGMLNGYNAFYKKLCEYYGYDATDIMDVKEKKYDYTNDVSDFVLFYFLCYLWDNLWNGDKKFIYI